jgi:hypothetical protein
MKKLLSILLLPSIHIGISQTVDYIAVSKKLVESVKSQDGKAADYDQILKISHY